jgi:hypothetical protein
MYSYTHLYHFSKQATIETRISLIRPWSSCARHYELRNKWSFALSTHLGQLEYEYLLKWTSFFSLENYAFVEYWHFNALWKKQKTFLVIESWTCNLWRSWRRCIIHLLPLVWSSRFSVMCALCLRMWINWSCFPHYSFLQIVLDVEFFLVKYLSVCSYRSLCSLWSLWTLRSCGHCGHWIFGHCGHWTLCIIRIFGHCGHCGHCALWSFRHVCCMKSYLLVFLICYSEQGLRANAAVLHLVISFLCECLFLYAELSELLRSPVPGAWHVLCCFAVDAFEFLRVVW